MYDGDVEVMKEMCTRFIAIVNSIMILNGNDDKIYSCFLNSCKLDCDEYEKQL